jgi:hypothetical protein
MMLQPMIRLRVDATHELVKVYGEDAYVIEGPTIDPKWNDRYLRDASGNYVYVSTIASAREYLAKHYQRLTPTQRAKKARLDAYDAVKRALVSAGYDVREGDAPRSLRVRFADDATSAPQYVRVEFKAEI